MFQFISLFQKAELFVNNTILILLKYQHYYGLPYTIKIKLVGKPIKLVFPHFVLSKIVVLGKKKYYV